MREARGPDERGDRLFAPLAADYAAARPSYPAAVFEIFRSRLEALDLGEGSSLALDVAAGTGTAARGLLDQGLRVAVVEPAAGMLAQAVRSLHGRPGWVGGMAARAEALPVVDTAAAGVVVAQAFHWLEPRPALDEIARVLRPGGTLLLLWNVTQPDDFTREVWALVERHNPGRKRPVTPEMRQTPASLAAHPAFTVEPTLTMNHERQIGLDDYVRYARSWSYIGGALPAAELERFERELGGILERHASNGSVVEHFATAAHFARRL